MYASCSNYMYPCLLVCDCPSTKIVLQYANCLPFQCGFIHKQSYVLVRCCSFAFNVLCNIFICLSSFVSLCLVLTLSL
jgi:hypothetical protein